MKEVGELECMTQEELKRTKIEMDDIVEGISKNEVGSIKGMILPPMFTLNILKLVYMLLNSNINLEDVTWVKIKLELLSGVDIFQRKYGNFETREFEDEEIDIFEEKCKKVFDEFGDNIETKSELYGPFVQKMCKFCIKARTILHGSKFIRNED